MTTSDNEGSGEEHTKGEILVMFKMDVAEEEARELVRSLGLSSGKWIGGLHMLFVEVPEGTEGEWAKKFKEEHADKVKDTALSPIAQASDEE